MQFFSYLTGFGGLFYSSAVFAQQATGEAVAAGRGNFYQMIAMIGVAIAFFYFIVLRPERKRRKAMDERRGSLKKGDRVTAVGILGTVVRVLDTTVVLKLYDGAKMEILKAAISDVQAGAAAEQEEATVELVPERT